MVFVPGVRRLPVKDIMLFAYAGAQFGDYSRVNYYFQQQRSDRIYDLEAGVNWHWNKLWTLTSAIELYEG